MSTSKLQRYVSEQLGIYLAEYDIYENSRPKWLSGLELDFYIPEINIAIEVQGNQHFQFTPIFHKTYNDFLCQRKRDEQKKRECDNLGIKLHEICTETDADILIIDLFKKFHNIKDRIDDFKLIGDDPGGVKNDMSKDDYHCLLLIRKAKKIISKFIHGDKIDPLHLDKRVAIVVSFCRRYGLELVDKDMLLYYAKRKEIIEAKINGLEEAKERLRQRKEDGTYGLTAIPQPNNKQFMAKKNREKRIFEEYGNG